MPLPTKNLDGAQVQQSESAMLLIWALLGLLLIVGFSLALWA